MKKETLATKGNTVAGLEAKHIEEVLKLIESDEMREHLQKWFSSGSVRKPVEVCAEIVFNAPVPIELKLSLLTSLCEINGSKDTLAEVYLKNIQYHMNALDNATDGMVYGLVLYGEYDWEIADSVMFKSFNEVLEHIKSLDKQAGEINMDDADTRKRIMYSKYPTVDEAVLRHKIEEHGYGLVYELEMYPSGKYEELHASWLMNEAREILYTDFHCKYTALPARLGIPTPFQAGAIVITDCKPFAGEHKVLILENEDTFESVDGCGVTCIFINEYGNIDAGYFKSNEFVSKPERTYVSGLYRARYFTGELSEREAPLGVIKEALAKRPKLGREMFMCLNNLKMYTLDDHSNSNKNSISEYDYYGIGWDAFKKRFGL